MTLGSFIDLKFVLSRYRDFLKIVVPILNKDGVRIVSIGTLFLLCIASLTICVCLLLRKWHLARPISWTLRMLMVCFHMYLRMTGHCRNVWILECL